MTPQERSMLLGGAAVIAAVVALYLGVAAVLGGDEAPVDLAGQFIENQSGPGDGLEGDELGATATTSASIDQDANRDTTAGIDTSLSPETNPTVASTAAVPTNPTNPAIPSPSTTPTVGLPSTTAAVVTTPAPTAETTTSSVETTATTSATTEATTAPTTTVPTTAPTTVPSTVPSTSAPTTEPLQNGLDPVELEMYRLTNELRANPAGALARQKPMPSCVTDPFYGISIDSATGHPNPVPALVLNEAVSLQMARPWAVEMDKLNSLQHRPNSSAIEIYGQLNLEVSVTGENIAWFSGYPDAQAAQVHFEGWRESDTGHYCALISGTYTNIGVGHLKGSSRSWAVQNFFRLR